MAKTFGPNKHLPRFKAANDDSFAGPDGDAIAERRAELAARVSASAAARKSREPDPQTRAVLAAERKFQARLTGDGSCPDCGVAFARKHRPGCPQLS
jgi:hypothetical protein